MKRLRCLLLAVVMLVMTVPEAAAAHQPTYLFALTAEGKTEITVSTGDVITVTFTLQRTDCDEPYLMYAMQNEICYDSTFFRLVSDSILTARNVRTNDIALRDHYRAFYMNSLSIGTGQSWPDTVMVGSFQLEVIGTGGATKIVSRNPQMSTSDGSGSYPVTLQEVTVDISETCSVVFESSGGSAVPPQNIPRGEKAVKPFDPVKAGCQFAGWYRDIDCTKPWDFTTDTVDINMHLYAKWSEQVIGAKYTDVKPSDWYYDDVAFISAQGLMDGVGNGQFAPDQSTSRAMIVTILWRLAGKPAAQTKASFVDVPVDQWYTEAVAWAAENAIVTGYSASTFGPNDNISREQMAAILYRYGAYKGYDVSARTNLDVFQDGTAIGAWALDAMSWANAISIINGMPGDLLAPQGLASRCQTAAIFHRFCLKY